MARFAQSFLHTSASRPSITLVIMIIPRLSFGYHFGTTVHAGGLVGSELGPSDGIGWFGGDGGG